MLQVEEINKNSEEPVNNALEETHMKTENDSSQRFSRPVSTLF